jgi:hypothetical protein
MTKPMYGDEPRSEWLDPDWLAQPKAESSMTTKIPAANGGQILTDELALFEAAYCSYDATNQSRSEDVDWAWSHAPGYIWRMARSRAHLAAVPASEPVALSEHDLGIIRDIDAMAAAPNDNWWSRALALGASGLIKRLRAAPPAPVSGATSDELHFNAQRLRNVAKLTGLETAVPEDDLTLDGARGSVLGMIARKLRSQSAPAGAVVARPYLTVGQEPKYGGTLFNRVSGEAIPADEPVFIFRARDHYAARVIAHYMVYLPPSDHRVAVEQRARDFYSFAVAHPDRMKEPDTALPSPNPTGETK